MKLRAPLEDLKKSRRRPATVLLRLATISDFRPSMNEINEFDGKRLKSEDNSRIPRRKS